MDSTTNGFANHLLDGDVRPGKVDVKQVEYLMRQLLLALGQNPEEEGLRGTPLRVAKFWKEFIDYEPGVTETLFENGGPGQLVLIEGIRVFSMCEHHMMPFWCDVAIGYIARDRVLGLSKFPRIAQQFAHQLQIQERLGDQIADEVIRVTETENVGVAISGEHLCVSARGIRMHAQMKNLVTRGVFQTPEVQQRFFQLLSLGK